MLSNDDRSFFGWRTWAYFYDISKQKICILILGVFRLSFMLACEWFRFYRHFTQLSYIFIRTCLNACRNLIFLSICHTDAMCMRKHFFEKPNISKPMHECHLMRWLKVSFKLETCWKIQIESYRYFVQYL